MSNSNFLIQEKIKRRYSDETKKNTNSRLPSGIQFCIENEMVKMKLSSHAVASNMQEDDSAFEGWALVLKRWGNYKKVVLSWDKPNLIEDGHYQRFLFRVQHFYQDFPWFSIDDHCKVLLEDYRIKVTGKYLVNSPGKRGDTFRKTKEGELEYRFVNGDLNESLKNISNAVSLSRQLPIGVFENVISRSASIFTGGKSAIDIWGFSKFNDLLVFELKADNNIKVGIVSELYFYVSIIQMLRKQSFVHDKCNNEDILRIPKSDKIKAFFICPSIHPLIDEKILEMLSRANVDISYHYINFDKDYRLTLDIFVNGRPVAEDKEPLIE